jgi:uracil phosphoribosyltransferase
MGKLFVIDHPLIQHKLTLMRDKNTSTKEFKELLDEISTLMAYELTRELPLVDKEVETPICKSIQKEIGGSKICVVPILRAGLGMVEGILQLIPTAKVGHIGLYRDEKTLLPVTYYYKMPVDIAKGPVVIVDPALATGGSVDASIDYLKKEGCTNIKVMCIFASDVGVRLLYEKHPDVKIYAAQYIPTGLNEHGYIVTAAGDAGDRICGTCSYKPARPAKP